MGSFVDKDMNVTDNGDGTFTLITQFAGNEKWYGPDGEFLRPASGEAFRQAILVDENGEFLEFLGVVKDEVVDACPLVLEQIG